MTKMEIFQPRRYLVFFLLVMAVFCSACTSSLPHTQIHQFQLIGGHFYGPGPIEPDTPLPVGYLHNIHFDLDSFSGYAEFKNDGSKTAHLSDRKTPINQNIDAGVLEIDGGDNTVLLVAVNGGPNKGHEYYYLADDYSFVWKVDLALDPGFAEGIIGMDNFILTTGLIKIPNSLQTERGMPGGYDQAGSLRSGQYLAGRVGDYNQDGYLDGVLVAAPQVPLESQLLPGSPVGNQRGFESDVQLPAHLACELTLRSIAQFEEPVRELISKGEVDGFVKLLKDIRLRIDTAQDNMDRALIAGSWSPAEIKQQGFLIFDRLQTLRTLNFISISMTEYYPSYGGKFSGSTIDVVNKMFVQLHRLVEKINKINEKTKHQLPHKKTLLRL